MGKFKVGDKVIPINKTAYSFGLKMSAVWNWCIANNQPFMFITEVCVNDSGDYICGSTKKESGDYFTESDLIPYEDELKMGEKVLIPSLNYVRIFVYENDGKFYCVDSSDEDEYYRGNSFRVRPWNSIMRFPSKPKSIQVTLNDSHTAEVFPDKIIVGCQTFPIEVLDKLIEAKNNLK